MSVAITNESNLKEIESTVNLDGFDKKNSLISKIVTGPNQSIWEIFYNVLYFTFTSPFDVMKLAIKVSIYTVYLNFCGWKYMIEDLCDYLAARYTYLSETNKIFDGEYREKHGEGYMTEMADYFLVADFMVQFNEWGIFKMRNMPRPTNEEVNAIRMEYLEIKALEKKALEDK